MYSMCRYAACGRLGSRYQKEQRVCLRGLGKGNDIAYGCFIGQQHAQPVQAKGNATMRRCAHVKSAQQVSELCLRLLL